MPFADDAIGRDAAQTLFRTIQGTAPQANLSELDAAADQLGPLTLRARADLLRDALLAGLPANYTDFAHIIRAAAQNQDLRGWLIWPVTSAVAVSAVSEGSNPAFDDGLALLAELTGRFTSEFALRTFLHADMSRTIEIALEWTTSTDPAVRRLASEGTRPYLPWAVRVPALLEQPGVTVPILNRLYRDDSDDVRRSVANHINDLSRDDADLALATAARWLAHPNKNTDQLARRALRTLVKNGHTDSLATLGFTPANLQVTGPTLDVPELQIGQNIEFSASIRNIGEEPARVAIDYIVHHTRANGKQTGKTFKLTAKSIPPGESVNVRRRHSFRELTTRKYYPGPHAIELQINGVSSGRTDFALTAPEPSIP